MTTQFVFALVTTLGTQTISTEYFSGIQACLHYQRQLNTQHHHAYYHPKEEHIHARCLPARVDPQKVEIFDY
tara:strand:+ start:1801 stop:2016 length:216 start_codon:yes stop_codon:yes gene_type:complete